MPSPPVVFSSVRSAWVIISNTRPSMVGGMPTPSSATDTTAVPPSGPTSSRMWPPQCVLGRVGQQVRHDLGEPGRVPVYLDRLARRAARQFGSACLICGRAVSTAALMPSRSSTRPLRSSSFPRVIRLTSRRSSTSRRVAESAGCGVRGRVVGTTPNCGVSKRWVHGSARGRCHHTTTTAQFGVLLMQPSSGHFANSRVEVLHPTRR